MQPLQPLKIFLTKEQAEAAQEIGVDLLVSDFLAPLLGSRVPTELSRLKSARQGLTEGEAQELRAIGANVDYPPERTWLAFQRGEAWLRNEWKGLLQQSWNRIQVATFLGVTRGRVSQLQKRQSLYSFSYAGKNLFPEFQFGEHPPVTPGLSVILPNLRPGTHPVMVREFFITPSPDLLLEHEPVSPISWLSSGNDPEVVTALIRDI